MIKDIIFFEDYGLYSQCQLEAIKRGQKIAQFMADCVGDYLAIESFRNNQTLYVACQRQAEKEGKSIAELIEKACADKIGMTYKPKKKKGGILDLNRDA
jgi:hypothetical protein